MLAIVERDGYAVHPGLLRARETDVTARALERMSAHGVGTRNLLQRAWCRALVLRVKQRVFGVGTDRVAVQCTLFDKTAERNWLVGLHQDLSIPVKERIDHPELRGWSSKEGKHYVQPPVEVLEKLLAVRVHIDDCGPENGPLRVVPGSHRHGRLGAAAGRQMRDFTGEVECAVKAGDAMLMRPLILHASSKSAAPARRRVLHIVFGPRELPFGLEWKTAV